MTALDEARARVDEMMNRANAPGLAAFKRLALGGAVVAAQAAERIGDEYDTRVLSGVLTEALAHADQQSDGDAVALYGGELLAVLSDLADNGDEEAAEGVNLSAAALPAVLVRYGAACAARRKEQRNG
jgi:hypothetical protein